MDSEGQVGIEGYRLDAGVGWGSNRKQRAARVSLFRSFLVKMNKLTGILKCRVTSMIRTQGTVTFGSVWPQTADFVVSSKTDSSMTGNRFSFWQHHPKPQGCFQVDLRSGFGELSTQDLGRSHISSEAGTSFSLRVCAQSPPKYYQFGELMIF